MTILFGILACTSFALYAWQFFLGARFRFNHRLSTTSFPGVTMLKPLKGCDSETEGCLRTWLEQDYTGRTQVLFGVASDDDPAVKLVREKLKAEVLICPRILGPNAKVSTLAQLEPLIEHALIIISDADVAVPKHFLKEFVAFFESERPAVASCLYQLSGASNLAMHLEAFMVNSDFWTQVLQSRALKPMKFALGAAMAITRSELARLGGFHALVDYVADDYQLGNRAAGKVALCPMVVECRAAPMRWREVGSHQLRWTRTIRACQPVAFFFSILSNPTVWIVSWAIASGAWVPAVLALALRSMGGAWLSRKLTGRLQFQSIILAPFSDILRALFWLLAFTGNRVYWGGRWFRIAKGGKLTPEITGG